MDAGNVEVRRLSTGHVAAFDRDGKTLYLVQQGADEVDLTSRSELDRLVEARQATVLDRAVLVSLYDELSRIALLEANRPME